MSGTAETEELPRANIKRVVKNKLAEIIKDDPSPKDIAVNKEALIAFSESARIFIHYLSATANDICRESKRQTMNAEDVLKALEEMEFPELLEPLRNSLTAFRKQNASKKSESKTKNADRKRKSEVDLEIQNGNGKHAEDANEMQDDFVEEPREDENDDMEEDK
uniref:Transcription factor CBF/NF-Y/archaeal histone domain-containing protein n=1 Tax=Araucaria cunninghamii TaxID=56994 RepID=A0A0D6R336_ARACU